MASGTPRECAVRSSDSSSARAIPRLRCVGETVTPLIDQASTLRCPGTVSGPAQELRVATGVPASSVSERGDEESQTPVVRR
jgi:hypothetical protein